MSSNLVIKVEDDGFGEEWTIMERREWLEERAAIMEYCGGLPEVMAERLAMAEARQKFPGKLI